MSDKMREEFNAWIDSLDFKQLDDLCEQSAWDAWQASRNAVVVELPLWRHNRGVQYLEPREVKEALDAAGIGYK